MSSPLNRLYLAAIAASLIIGLGSSARSQEGGGLVDPIATSSVALC